MGNRAHKGDDIRVNLECAPMSITVDNGTEFASKAMDAWAYQYGVQLNWKCCNFENGDGGGPERNWAARSQAAISNSLSMN